MVKPLGRGLHWAMVLALAAAGCGSRRPPPTGGHGDAGDAGVVADAALDAAPPPARAGTAPPYRVIDVDDATGGRLAVDVKWPAASAEMRRSPGRTACGTARPPRARIGTLHGVAGVVVVVDVAAGKEPPPATDVRVTIRECAIAPAMILAPGLGGTVEIQSQDEAPHHVIAVALAPAASLPQPAPLAAASLPAMGHTVSVPLAKAGVVRLAADGADADAAYVVAPPHPYAAITDDAGAAAFDRIPPGTYDVSAWLAPAAGQPELHARGSAVIAAGADATLTLTLTLAAP